MKKTIRMIANAVFVLLIVKTARYALHLISPKQKPRYLRIAIKPSSDVISRRFAADDEYDGIELTYNTDDVSDAQKQLKYQQTAAQQTIKK